MKIKLAERGQIVDCSGSNEDVFDTVGIMLKAGVVVTAVFTPKGATCCWGTKEWQGQEWQEHSQES